VAEALGERKKRRQREREREREGGREREREGERESDLHSTRASESLAGTTSIEQAPPFRPGNFQNHPILKTLPAPDAISAAY
jgi:hypothetical protein